MFAAESAGKTDVCGFAGHWPLRRMRRHAVADLRAIHRGNGITGGLVSSLPAVFYNDPAEGDEELHLELRQAPGYRQVLTVNPALPGFARDIETGVARYGAAAVRIYPGYHGYRLDDRALGALRGVLAAHNLPLFVTLRLEDARVSYLAEARTIPMAEVEAWLRASPDTTTILTHASAQELRELGDMAAAGEDILEFPESGDIAASRGAGGNPWESGDIAVARSNGAFSRLYADTSGLRELYAVEKLLRHWPAERLLFGSLYPLNSFKSVSLAVEDAQIDRNIIDGIMGRNAARLFAIRS